MLVDNVVNDDVVVGDVAVNTGLGRMFLIGGLGDEDDDEDDAVAVIVTTEIIVTVVAGGNLGTLWATLS